MTIKNTDQQFKKTEQEVNRPPVTDHNINDEYMKSPPNNLQDPIVPVSAKDAATEREPMEVGVLGHEETGREKARDAEARIVQENTVGS